MKAIDALRLGAHTSLAAVTDDCTRCGWATWQVEPTPGHWLCGHGEVKRAMGRERVAVGVARAEVCGGRWHTKARAA